MNIALLMIGFSKGEIEEATKITTLSLARELRNQGHNPIIISDGRKEFPKYEEINGIKVFRPYRTPFLTNNLFRLINHTLSPSKGVRYVEKKLDIEFDIIHNFSSAPLAALRGILARKLSKKAKLVHTIKSHSKISKNKFSPGSYYYSKYLNHCDAITTLTQTNVNLLTENGADKSKIRIIRSHIDLSKFKPLDKAKLRKKYKVPKQKTIITYYGPLHERKGTEYLLKSIPLILKEYPNALFLLLCKTPTYLKKYDDLIEELKIKKNIKLTTKKVKIVECINLSDLIVLPYPHLIATESNPSCLLESMACAIPVITTDLAELREIVTNKKEVLMARPKDEEDFAEKVIELLSNKKLKEEIVKNGLKKSKEFDVKEITKEYLGLYEKLILP